MCGVCVCGVCVCVCGVCVCVCACVVCVVCVVCGVWVCGVCVWCEVIVLPYPQFELHQETTRSREGSKREPGEVL